MYLLVCIWHFAKKFPQACFHHEIRLKNIAFLELTNRLWTLNGFSEVNVMLRDIVYQLVFWHLSAVQPLVEQLHETRYISVVLFFFSPSKKKKKKKKKKMVKGVAFQLIRSHHARSLDISQLNWVFRGECYELACYGHICMKQTCHLTPLHIISMMKANRWLPSEAPHVNDPLYAFVCISKTPELDTTEDNKTNSAVKQ